jgi:thiol-disulfide isomerase/thioredoxin
MKPYFLLVGIFCFLCFGVLSQEKKYKIICNNEILSLNTQGSTLEPLEVITIDDIGLSQINKYSFDTRHRAYKEFKQRLISKDSFSIFIDKYLIDTANLYKWEKENQLLVLVKKKEDGSCIVIPDINHNGKFSDDSIYTVKNPVKEELIFSYKMNFWYHKKYTRKFDIVFMPNPSHVPKRYDKAIFNTWGGARKIMKGKLRIGVDSFLVYTFLPGNSIYYTKYNSRFSISSPNENYIDIYKTGYPIYSLSDTIYAGNEMIMLDTLSILGDTVIFKSVGKSEYMSGLQKGAVVKYVSGNEFLTEKYREINLKRSDDKYTLLHFWGSWCGPCIENLPKISSFYNSYQNRVDMIGFPYETKKDIPKAKSLMQKYSMNWTQISQPIDDPFQKADVVKQLRIDAFPTYILLNSNGVIVVRTSNLEEVEKYFLQKE